MILGNRIVGSIVLFGWMFSNNSKPHDCFFDDTFFEKSQHLRKASFLSSLSPFGTIRKAFIKIINPVFIEIVKFIIFTKLLFVIFILEIYSLQAVVSHQHTNRQILRQQLFYIFRSLPRLKDPLIDASIGRGFLGIKHQDHYSIK